MKILLVSYYFGKCASGNITHRVCNELKQQGHEVYVVTSDSPIKSVYVYQCKNLISDNSILWRAIQKIYRILIKDELKNYNWIKRAYREGCRIINEKEVDCIYCRTSPLEACEVGYKLKKKTGIKTLLHFTDPEPSEFVIKNKIVLKRAIEHYKTIISSVDLISFGTNEMKLHQENLFGYCFGEKSFVSPDVSRDTTMRFMSKSVEPTKRIIVYLGSFGNYRNPIPLFKAVDSLNEKGVSLQLNIYSKCPRTITYHSDNIVFHGTVVDIDIPLQTADVLVDIDADFENNPYLSSKIKDYIPVNRPILVVSKPNTPVYNLAKNRHSFMLVSNDEYSIEKGLIMSLNYGYNMEKYSDRIELINIFSPRNVVKSLINKLNENK